MEDYTVLYRTNVISMFHLAFFNSIIGKHQHMHFFTFNTALDKNVDFKVNPLAYTNACQVF